MPFTSGTAAGLGRLGGQRSGETRAARAALTPDEVAAALLPMDSPDNVRQNLDTVARWAACGRLSAGHAGAIVRAASEALRGIDLGAELGQLAELRSRLDAIEAEKRQRPHGVA